MSKKRAEITQRDMAHRQNAIILTGISIFLLLHFLIYNLKLKYFQIFIKAKHIFQMHKESFFFKFFYEFDTYCKKAFSLQSNCWYISIINLNNSDIISNSR